jgi:hypothetical protein
MRSPMLFDREIANAKAERFYSALLLLSSVPWCAFALQNWQRIADACSSLENPIQTGDLGRTKEQMESALNALDQIQRRMRTIPKNAEEWSALDKSVRDCLGALGFDSSALPDPNAFLNQ